MVRYRILKAGEPVMTAGELMRDARERRLKEEKLDHPVVQAVRAVNRAGKPYAGAEPEEVVPELPGNLPRHIAEDSGETTLPEAQRMVLAGDLKLTDLVDVGTGRGWQTVEECYELAEQVEKVAASERQTRAILVVAVTLIVVGTIVAALA